jgi:hypothetical protein
MMATLLVLSLGVLVLFGIYLVVLGAAALRTPMHTSRFLSGFAASPTVHYLELTLRAIVGAAFVVRAPEMAATTASSVFGWTLLATTAILAVLPWHWHREFARRAIPRLTRYPVLIGLVSFALGAAVLAATLQDFIW